jgi:hypothetical protein
MGAEKKTNIRASSKGGQRQDSESEHAVLSKSIVGFKFGPPMFAFVPLFCRSFPRPAHVHRNHTLGTGWLLHVQNKAKCGTEAEIF